MAEEIITKRLQVSGLTPAITPAELGAKLGSFGSVKALDGFGVLNAVGQPRKFGYVTIETTKAKLAKCMNLLSGVTWKGAKLRMGEAKPDFRERIAKEHEPPADDAPARKKRRLAKGVQGLHAVDMSLVTPENVQDRGGWRVTPLGKIVRPIRMRPEHPLPEPLPKAPIAKAKEKKDKKTGVVKEKRKRVKEPPTRARRRTIDPTKWDSQHLKGVFLDSGLAPTNVPIATQEVEDDSDSSDDSGEEEAARNEVEPINEEAEVEVELEASVPTPKPQAPTLSKSQIQDASSDLREESKTALGLLQSLFAGDEWGGAESVGSDVDMNDIGNITELDDDVTDEVETVPRQDTDVVMGHIQTPVTSDEEDETDEEESPKQPSKSQSQQTKLKDLFAPREEEGE
ncbi:hypothetical protein EUX98_g5814 [Antrodiella citrinella]|uniref:RRM domain-containing protein n=1 Tax=Antrodiella citrinella TaxID=2447956 RepID=A0A4S4MSD5_9APHY|nr:hypothetical protein EUX98_g5814 [Antrodiella citrinella]